ncbi:MAG: cobyrinate a,c-diamide synthase [Nitrospira sp.]|mgnify:CR=1 FL=1|uniref:Cobyrinate a,c-diamide synthase n=2 Tax=Nitrospira defluvii TaxID=330214 RepID=A0ABN7LSI6_9BACT|nr:cobyrinate a,c-diamide synthase [Nitrospira sp.]CAE6767257.1 Cobyrinate a,c-diamide synthase [Nitrospira defluvii]
MHRPRLIIAGTHSGAGKTTVTLALLAALKENGLVVQPCKAGPDFIDPGHHQVVTGRPSRNLDGWMLGETVNRAIFSHASADADLSIIEGMMGLFDGSSPTQDKGSTAELAKQLQAPVLLVIDGSAMARSAAAMAFGYAKFDPAVRVVGVLFNRVKSEGHYRLLRDAVRSATDLEVVGYLEPDPAMAIADRHLGLRTAIEEGQGEVYARLAQSATRTIDVNRVIALARSADDLVLPAEPALDLSVSQPQTVRVGVAYDAAFCFYYQDNLEMLKAAGAEIVLFSPLRDATIPDVDLLYFGGGYPELYGEALAANAAIRSAIRAFSERGGAIYAECGGLMYLTQAIRDMAGHRHEMVGVISAEAVMRKAGMTLGYRTVRLTQPCLLGPEGTVLRGHEFHYSLLEPTGELQYVCALSDADGKPVGPDGVMRRKTLALYSHQHFGSCPDVVGHLLGAARRARRDVAPARTA